MQSTLVKALLSLSLFFTVGTHVASAQTAHYAVGGRIVTPSGVLPHAWIEINKGRISRIYTTRTSLPMIPVLDTEDLVFPGFIDLHNHPPYNIFPRWSPTQKYSNRYAWRDSEEFRAVIGNAASVVLDDDANFCDIDEYVEVKALIGGTTSIVGLSDAKAATATIPAHATRPCVKGLVRNLDSYTGFYGPDTDHERIVDSVGILHRDMDANVASLVASRLHDGSLDLLAIHIAEGLPTDPETQTELDLLETHGLLTDHTVLIHAVGLSPIDYIRIHHANASIVWSPRSNFELYGTTANIAAAFREGVTVALAPDWSPTGSDNMLDEIRYASQVSNVQFDGLFGSRALVEMATSIPARIARIDDKVGSIAVGELADFFLVKPHGNISDNPYDSLAQSNALDIEMVAIQGQPLYGTPDDLGALSVAVEKLDLCGHSRALNSAALPSGSFESVSQRLRTKLKAAGTDLGPLIDCPK